MSANNDQGESLGDLDRESIQNMLDSVYEDKPEVCGFVKPGEDLKLGELSG